MYIIGGLLFFTVSSFCQEPSSPPEIPPIIIKNIFHEGFVVVENDIHTNAKSDSKSFASTTTNVNVITKIRTELSAILSNTANKLPALNDYLCKNKWFICRYTTLITYIYLCAKLILDNHYINRSDLWAHWKQDHSLTQLCTLSPDALRKELIMTIQQRYLNTDNPTDSITPMTHFLHNIKQEEKRLKSYCRYGTWLTSTWLRKIFPINQNKINNAQNLIERLAFVHHLFLSWATERNWLQTQSPFMNNNKPTAN